MRWLFVAALGLMACEVDGTIGTHEPDGGSGGGTGGMSSSSSTAAAGTGVGSGGGGGTSATDGSSSASESGGGSTTRDSGATDVPHACIPTPDDSACSRCRKDSCCGLLDECLAHDTCTCWWDCVATDHTTDECIAACDTDGVRYQELALCAQMRCDSCS